MRIVLLGFWLLFSADPWGDKEIVQPKALADQLAAKPEVFYVGFPILYTGGPHIASAKLAGPCSKAEGIEALKKAVADLPRSREIFIYCGCCPFVKCPNIRPAYSALHQMGFSNVKTVKMETNLHTDWVEKGYPTENAARPQ